MEIKEYELSNEQLNSSCFVDLSWMLHRGFHAMKQLSVQNSQGTIIPTGHVYFSLKTILSLSALYSLRGKLIILCVDSRSNKAGLLKSYKKNRPEGGYSIYNDLSGIIASACQLPNVFYLKKDGYESDDFINSAVRLNLAPEIYGRDSDLLLTKGDKKYFQDIFGSKLQYIDIIEYLHKTFSVDLEYLPIWHMIIRGKASNNMKPSYPRFPSATLDMLVSDLLDEQSLEGFVKYCQYHSKKEIPDLYNKHLDACIHNPEIWEAIKLNHSLVIPQYLDSLVFKKAEDKEMVSQFFEDKEMDSLKKFWVL